MSYEMREMTVQITLVSSTFDDKGNTTIKMSGIRCHATHQASGGISGFTMSLTLWGMALEHIAKIIGPGILLMQEKKNKIKVWTGDDVFFEGFISTAAVNMNGAPDLALELTCRSAGLAQMTQVTDTEIKETMTFESAVNLIAKKANLTVTNYAESFTVSPAVYKGSTADQLSQIAEAYRLKKIKLDVGFDFVDILQYGTPRDDTVLECGPDAGLIGYPNFNEFGILFSCMYTPKIRTATVIRLTTDLPNASGDWVVATATHEVSSWVDNGPWFSHVVCTKKGGNAS